MRAVGVRELKERASELVRIVREEGEEIDVTYHGQVVARIIPVKQKPSSAQIAALITEMDKLAAEIGAHWPKGLSAAEAISQDRRDL